MKLMRYDDTVLRVCAELPYSKNGPERLVPGAKFDPEWKRRPDAAPIKVWHWPSSATPVILRSFPLVETDDPFVEAMLRRGREVNAWRAASMARAREIAARFDSVDLPRLPDGRTLREHQRGAVRRTLAAGGSRGLGHETGTGKTLTAGTLLSMMVQPVDGMRVGAVVCPVTLIEAAWSITLPEWLPDLPIVSLRDHRKGKARELAVANALRAHGRVVVLTNYESVWSDRSVRKILSGAYVVFDECSKMKSHKSRASTVAREIAPTFRGAVLLSGTPAPNGNHEYWPHAKLLACPSGYDAFPGSVYQFNKEFCNVKTFQRRGRSEPCIACGVPKGAHDRSGCGQFKAKENYAGMAFDTTKTDLLHERLSPIFEWIKKDECLDLPAKVYQPVPVALSRATADAYVEMRDRMVVKFRGVSNEQLQVQARNVLAQYMRLRQITAGFVPADKERWVAGADDNTVLLPIGREKIDWTIDALKDTGDRMVVWAQFIFEAERYVKELREAKVSCESITGATPERDRAALFKRFVDGDFQALIAHPGVAKYGVSLPGVSLASYASCSFSLEEYRQSQDRIHGIGRGDATKHSTFYLLRATARGEPTIDELIQDALDGKGNLLDLVFKIDKDRRDAGFVPTDVGERIGTA